jgi:hypothetical protein
VVAPDAVDPQIGARHPLLFESALQEHPSRGLVGGDAGRFDEKNGSESFLTPWPPCLLARDAIGEMARFKREQHGGGRNFAGLRTLWSDTVCPGASI